MMIRAEHVTREQMEAADGQAELADEIAVRGSAEEAKSAAPTTVKKNTTPEEPPVAVTKTAEDLPATSEA